MRISRTQPVVQTEEKENSVLQSENKNLLVSLYATGLIKHLIPFLTETDMYTTQRTSKKWKKLINLTIKSMCLTHKAHPSTPWIKHYIRSEYLNTFMRGICPITLYFCHSRKIHAHNINPNTRYALFTNQNSRFGCYVAQEPSSKTSLTCRIWDMKTDQFYKEIYLYSDITRMAYAYPYLLSTLNKKYFIRDISSKANKIVMRFNINAQTKIDSFSLSQYGFSFLYYQSTKTYVGFHTIKDGKKKFYGLVNNTAPVQLLHEHLLIYSSIAPGQVKIRDITKKNCPIIGGYSQEEIKLPPESTNITSMVANNMCLVSLSTSNILIYDLKELKVMKRLQRPAWCLGIEQVIQHTLFIHTKDEIRALDFNGAIIQKWDNVYLDQEKQLTRLPSVGVYKNKFYINHLCGSDFSGFSRSLRAYDLKKAFFDYFL